MFLIQAILLKLFGLLPLTNDKNTYRSVVKFRIKLASFGLTIVAVVLLVGTLFSTTFTGAIFVYSLVYPTSEVAETLVLRVMQLTPYFMMNLRAFIVILLLFMKRRDWPLLMRHTREFMQSCFSASKSIALRRRMGRISIGLAFVTFTMHCIWECGEWSLYFNSLTNFTMTDDHAAGPLMPLMIYQFMILWTCFCTVPFILSQQVQLHFLFPRILWL